MTEVQSVQPADEGRHEPGAGELWNESWYLDVVDPAAGVAAYVRLGLYPNLGRAWYWACVVGPDRPLVTVIDHDVPLPSGRSLEIRTEGLWADYNVESPCDHVSVGVEAFAVSLDDAADVYGDPRGDRVPFGLDLEWETDGDLYPYPGVDRYEVPSLVSGEILVGQETIAIDGIGQRDHSWGERDWWTYGWSWMSGRFDDGTRFHGTQVQMGDVQLYGTGYLQVPGDDMVGVDDVARSEDLGRAGFPDRARWRVWRIRRSRLTSIGS